MDHPEHVAEAVAVAVTGVVAVVVDQVVVVVDRAVPVVRAVPETRADEAAAIAAEAVAPGASGRRSEKIQAWKNA